MRFSILGFMSLFTIVIWDLKYDFADYETSFYYYYGDQTAQPIFKLYVPILLVLTAISLVSNIIKNCKFTDILTVLVTLPTLYIFAVILIPNQELLGSLTSKDTKVPELCEVNKYFHLVLLPIMFFATVFQTMSDKEDNINVKDKTN